MYYIASKIEFMLALMKAGQVNENVRTSCTEPRDLPDCSLTGDAFYYLHADEQSGFGLITHHNTDIELIAVFSSVKGRGQAIMELAESMGANYLDHFDGYLSEFYEARGWIEYKRLPNWTAGNPDVIYRVKD